MARKKHRTQRRHRRRRVSGMKLNAGAPVVKLVSVAAGYFLADTINGMIDKVIPASVSTSTTAVKYLPAAAQVGIGGALVASKKKPNILKTVGGGILLGSGIKRALKSFGVIAGYQTVPVIGKNVAGYQSVPVVGMMPPQLSGAPTQLTGGFRVNGGYQPTGSGAKIMGATNPGAADTGSGITISDSSGYMQ